MVGLNHANVAGYLNLCYDRAAWDFCGLQI